QILENDFAVVGVDIGFHDGKPVQEFEVSRVLLRRARPDSSDLRASQRKIIKSSLTSLPLTWLKCSPEPVATHLLVSLNSLFG
ncbi:MAG: hypothetical protein V2J42_12055, partial [Wenzhouxiangella sp.]|nr:hypothetical protein [Wenzhouxiangella sp.]